MEIIVNGKSEILEKQIVVKEFLLRRNIKLDHVVLEYNQNILPQAEWETKLLCDGDTVEILSFVGGG